VLVVGNAVILKKWMAGTNGNRIWPENLGHYSKRFPVTIMGVKNSYSNSIIEQCIKEGRDYYILDTGYFGNHIKGKIYYRIILNGFHHSKHIEVPDDRFKSVINKINHEYDVKEKSSGLNRYNFFSEEWRDGENILVVTPGGTDQKFRKFDAEKWVTETVSILKKHTDRKIIIRKKPARSERIGNNHIYNQLIEDNILAVVTTNSVSAAESIGFGVPCFTFRPHSVQDLCSEDFSKIETPYYPDRDKVLKYFHWLAYCQYTKNEIENGTAHSIIKQYGLK
jgi:hypothetical protein